MRYFKGFLLAILLPTLILSACKNNDDIENPEIPVEINFAIGLNSLNDTVVKRTWTTNDSIGIYAVASGSELEASDNPVHNLKLVFNGTTWVSTGTWPEDIENLDFYAYYPYSAAASDPTNLNLEVLSNQSQSTDFSEIDFLSAKATDVKKGDTIKLNLKSALTVVQLSIPYQGKGFGPNKDLKAYLNGVNTKANVNLFTGVVTSSEEADVEMARVETENSGNYETSYTYRAIIPAQTKAAGSALFKYIHENRQTLTDTVFSTDSVLHGGIRHNFVKKLPLPVIETSLIANVDRFQMGSPITEYYRQTNENAHLVKLSKSYYMSKYEVTNAQFVEFLNANNVGSDGKFTAGSYPDEIIILDSRIIDYDYGVHWNGTKWEPAPGYDDYPVMLVSWYGATEFAKWIGATLPTEAQWEYACRGGQELPNPYAVGAQTKFVAGMGNFYTERPYDNDKQGGYYSPEGLALWTKSTTKVGTYEPNGYGLYDMHGNVWEWCSDYFDNDYYSTYPASTIITDPRGPSTGTARVFRGGAWDSYGHRCRTAYREYGLAWNRVANLGFRVVFVAQ